jgi:hypothetical protein
MPVPDLSSEKNGKNSQCFGMREKQTEKNRPQTHIATNPVREKQTAKFHPPTNLVRKQKRPGVFALSSSGIKSSQDIPARLLHKSPPQIIPENMDWRDARANPALWFPWSEKSPRLQAGIGKLITRYLC